MTTNSNIKPLNKRAFVAIVAALSGLLLPVTGLANHFLQLEPLAGSRHAWMSAHNALGLIFAVFAVWHVILNRRAFMRHAKGFFASASAAGSGRNREVLWAVTTVCITLLVAVGHTFLAG